MRRSAIPFAALVLFLASVSAYSQGNTGSILGTFTDQSGKVVPDVKVVFSDAPMFGNPNVTVDAGTAGQISSASNERNIQLELKFNF